MPKTVSGVRPAARKSPLVSGWPIRMDSTEPLHSPLTGAGPSFVPLQPASAPDQPPGPIDPELIDRTRREIREILDEIDRLAESDVSLAEFQEAFLNRVVSALAAVGGAIWMAGDDGALKLQYQINLTKTGLAEDEPGRARHDRLLTKVFASGRPVLIAPRSGSEDDDESGNPTDYVLVMGILKIDRDVQGVVEIFQRPGNGPATQRGYLRFLTQTCERASDFLTNRRLRHLGRHQDLFGQLEAFIAAVHHRLDTRATAYAIANEGRNLIQCDRVSVAVRQGRRLHVAAVSGLDTVDRRSGAVAALNAVATAAIDGGESVWYTGDASDAPSPLEQAVQTYAAAAHCKTVAVVPLIRPADEENQNAGNAGGVDPENVIGALVIEQINETRRDGTLRRRVEVVARHSAAALANALEHDGVFLMPLWRTLGKARWLVKARTLPKTLVAAAVAMAAVIALLVVPADFELEGRGSLQPVIRREVFAGIDGVVTDVPVQHGQQVEPQQHLAQLRNTDLDVQLTGLIGRRTAAQEQISSVSRALLGENRLSLDEQNRLAGQLIQLKETEENLQQQLALVQQKKEQLVVRSPIGGQVVTWEVRNALIHRPVQKGQVLMTVVDPTGDWELEIHMPESRMGHVARARKDAPEDLKATFALKTHPGETFAGRVTAVHAAADVHGAEGNTVLIKVAIDKNELPDLRPGATVTAKIHCGRRPIGYVWFHDLIAFVQSKILFWT